MTDTRTHPEEFRASYLEFMYNQLGDTGRLSTVRKEEKVRLSTDTAHNKEYMAWFHKKVMALNYGWTNYPPTPMPRRGLRT